MPTGTFNADAPPRPAPSLRKLAPLLPLSPLQPALERAVRYAARRRPEIFDRLGEHARKSFLIDPVNLPFPVLLRPDPDRLSLSAVRRDPPTPFDARIAGSALTLLAMVDGRRDGDALFFSRDIQVSGDTEAVVSLRNALDDLDGSIADDVAAAFGPAGRAMLAVLRRIGDSVDPA